MIQETSATHATKNPKPPQGGSGTAPPSHLQGQKKESEEVTLRDFFAVHADSKDVDDLVGPTRKDVCDFLGITSEQFTPTSWVDAHAKGRYMFADAMMRARAKNQDGHS